MRIVVLGSAGYHPNDRRDTSCYFLPEEGIVLDAGTGFHRVRDRLMTSSLDIYLSHAHLDHVIGLTYLPGIIWQRNVDRVRVHGESEKLSAIDVHLFASALFPLPPNYVRHVVDERPFDQAGYRVTPFKLSHPGGSLGYRFDWADRSMAYVTDTTAAADAGYVRHIQGVDLLIHECNFRDEESEWSSRTGHSCTSEVAQVAAVGRVGRLLLTHFNPLEHGDDPVGLDVARSLFPRTDLAADGMEIEF